MIVGINGIIEKKEPMNLHINVNGLVYSVNVSVNCSALIDSEVIKLYTTYVIKENSQDLFGFLDINEKKMFDTLIKINGVGPKVAMATCSTFTPKEFMQILKLNDKNSLKKVAGIGPKGATRILIELSDFKINDINTNSNFLDAVSALESLGFKRDNIEKVLLELPLTTVSELVKEGLKRLGKI